MNKKANRQKSRAVSFKELKEIGDYIAEQYKEGVHVPPDIKLQYLPVVELDPSAGENIDRICKVAYHISVEWHLHVRFDFNGIAVDFEPKEEYEPWGVR